MDKHPLVLVRFCHKNRSTEAMEEFIRNNPEEINPVSLSTCFGHCLYYHRNVSMINALMDTLFFDPLIPGLEGEFPLLSALLYGSVRVVIAIVSRIPPKVLEHLMNDLENNPLHSTLYAHAAISQVSPLTKCTFLISLAREDHPILFVNQTNTFSNLECVTLYEQYMANPKKTITHCKATPFLVAKYHHVK